MFTTFRKYILPTWTRAPLSVNNVCLLMVAFCSTSLSAPTFGDPACNLVSSFAYFVLDVTINLIFKNFYFKGNRFTVFYVYSKGVINQVSIIFYFNFFHFFIIFCSCKKYNMAAVLQSLSDHGKHNQPPAFFLRQASVVMATGYGAAVIGIQLDGKWLY